MKTDGFHSGLLRNLRGGLGLLGLRHRPPDAFVRTFDQLAALFILNLLVWAALDTLHAEAGAELRLDGLYNWSFYLLLGFLACGVVARAYSWLGDTRALLIPALAVSPFVLAAFWLLSDLPQLDTRPAFRLVAAVLYMLVLSVRVIQAAYGRAPAKAVAPAVVLVLAAPFVLTYLDLDTRLWLTDDVGQEQADDTTGEEALLYDQPAQLVAAVEHMAPREAGQTNVFYLGFAGDGEQEIFKREELFGQQVLGEHFGSDARSVDLINDNDDRDSFPIASVSAVQQSLKLIASRMDLDEDMLVMLLTSHGSHDDGLAVVNGSIPLMQLSPTELRRALDESGIKWRIVIVSACYAGGFADALRSNTTAVITASDADHSSFGCDDERELTYFGEAFLKDSLPNATTLEEAFKKAAGVVRERETSEQKIHSNPQISVGALMHDKLASVEGRSTRPSGNATTVSLH